MKHLKHFFAVLLVLCMVFCLFGCGNNESSGDNQSSETGSNESESSMDESSEEESSEASIEDGKVTYKVTVVDENNAPIAGAIVQLCLEMCTPNVTDAEGVAEYSMEEADYKVAFVTLPAGYTYSTDETEFYFEDGSYEMTITLKAAE